MKKILIGLLVVVLVLVGTYMYFEWLGQKELEKILTEQNIPTESVATTSETVAEPKYFTMAEISAHNNRQDCWMTINGQVLDVTTFVDKHPGGEAILQGCGKDATGYFNKVPGHMKGIAQLLLKKMTIGTLAK